MTATAIRQLIDHLAAGEADAAEAYLKRIPVASRTGVVAGVRARVLPEVMAVFNRLAPWLVEPGDDLSRRILRALQAAERAGLSRTELRTKVSRVEPETMARKLDELVTARDVHVERVRTRGMEAMRYRLPQFARDIRPANENVDPFAYLAPE